MDKLIIREAVKSLLKGVLWSTIMIFLMIGSLKIERLEKELMDQRRGISLYPISTKLSEEAATTRGRSY